MFLNYNENDIAYVVYGPGASATTAFTFGKWSIPQAANFVTFICIGGGGGGGGGRSAAAGTAKGGGGGGGSAAMQSVTYHVNFLPESIAYAVGSGGNGGAAGVNGVNGANTTVFIPQTNFSTATGYSKPLVLATALGGSGGSGLQTTGAGGGGSAGLNAEFDSYYPLAGQAYLNGNILGLAGISGAAGATRNAANTTSFNASSLSGGGGGGGVSTTNIGGLGSSIVANTHSWVPTIVGGLHASASAGAEGAWSWKAFGGAGGAGGGSFNGTGGAGGAGAFGCGGGGGGAGTTAGAGGRGGTGMLVILAW